MRAETSQTIVAIATPEGEGALSIIRVSGPEARLIVNVLLEEEIMAFKTHTVHRCTLRDPQGNVLDQVLILPFLSPRSFTGEEVVEIHCHGNPLIAHSIVHAVCQVGARCASPGEFSMRAYLNGKMDLIQAEAIQQLIAADHMESVHEAHRRLDGVLSSRIQKWKSQLIDLRARVEANIDFSQEIDVDIKPSEWESIRDEMKVLLLTYDVGEQKKNGIRIALVGLPNVGKSSLFNALIQEERSIVTSLPGTTTDTIDRSTRLGNKRVYFVDTAGVRASDNVIERAGMERTHRSVKESDLVLYVVDLCSSSERLHHEKQQQHLDQLLQDGAPVWVVFNKRDLGEVKHSLEIGACPFYHVSSLTGEGLTSLVEALEQWCPSVYSVPFRLTTARHHALLQKAYNSLAIHPLQGERVREECLSCHLDEALESLNAIVGSDVSEEMLDSIFSQFCLGK